MSPLPAVSPPQRDAPPVTEAWTEPAHPAEAGPRSDTNAAPSDAAAPRPDTTGSQPPDTTPLPGQPLEAADPRPASQVVRLPPIAGQGPKPPKEPPPPSGQAPHRGRQRQEQPGTGTASSTGPTALAQPGGPPISRPGDSSTPSPALRGAAPLPPEDAAIAAREGMEPHSAFSQVSVGETLSLTHNIT